MKLLLSTVTEKILYNVLYMHSVAKFTYAMRICNILEDIGMLFMVPFVNFNASARLT